MISRDAISLLLAVVPCLAALGAGDLRADRDSAWQVNTLQKFSGNDRLDEGLIMYSDDSDQSGAALHCHFGDMTACLWDLKERFSPD